MSRVIMERRIYLEPSLLDGKIIHHLLEKIEKEILFQCDQTYGYVTKVYKKLKILNNVISSSGPGVFFTVKFGVDVIKPEVGLEYKGIVCMIFQTGIFVEVFEKMKVLIPSRQIDGYKFDKATGTFQKGNNIIEKGDSLVIKVNLIKYEKQNFNCIGSLKSSRP